jgi:hypothetical protein
MSLSGLYNKIGTFASKLYGSNNADKPIITNAHTNPNNAPVLNVYPDANGYIGQINIPQGYAQLKHELVDFIVILDISGSMGENISRILNIILPTVLENLGYNITTKIGLITFNNCATRYKITIPGLKKLNLDASGGTCMQYSILYLKNAITELANPNAKIRLLVISDGELQDQIQTLQESTNLAAYLKTQNYNINVQAIRFFTSYFNPDTRGLASVLQFGINTESALIDMHYTLPDKLIIEKMVALFKEDKLGSGFNIETTKEIMLATPWNKTKISTYTLKEGLNTIWFSELPTFTNLAVDIVVSLSNTVLDKETFNIMMKDKTDKFIQQMKILKVINTKEAKNEMNQILKYFKDFEQYVDSKDDFVLDSTLASRLLYYKKTISKRTKTISSVLEQIANDKIVQNLNSSQQAEYLRQIDSSKNNRNLARMAERTTLDFDSVVRAEIIDACSHLDEIQDIDDSTHLKSFFCQDTTLGGIKAVSELVKTNMINDMSANEILQMINIVGVACKAEIGSYPDSMTWRVDTIYPSTFLSVSDILASHVLSNGASLKPVGMDGEISTVIPIFCDERIQRWMQKYMSRILEYTCGIGMRRILADIPMTFSYSIVNGIWKMVFVLNETKSELHINIFKQLLKTYDVAIGSYFDHVIPYIKNQDPNLSYFIANNGITNMIGPLIKLQKMGNTQFTQQILRALYSFEIYQAVKRKFRSMSNGPTLINDMLNKIVGIDFDKYKTHVPKLFEYDENPVFHCEFHIDEELLNNTIKSFWYLDHVALLPSLLAAVYPNENTPSPYNSINSIPQLNDDFICAQLGIKCSLQTFKFYNIVQALIYNTKALRVDSENNCMRYCDAGTENNICTFISDFVKKQYVDKYQSDTHQKVKDEQQALKTELVKRLLETNDMHTYCQYFKDGIQLGKSKCVIINPTAIGYVELRDGLLDCNKNIPNRIEKIAILLLGKNSANEVVWNNGNKLITKLAQFEAIFKNSGNEDKWNEIFTEYKKLGLHIYREKENRHTHSNDKPSYWALGFETIEKMFGSVNSTEWAEYKKLHTNCCGFNRGTNPLLC